MIVGSQHTLRIWGMNIANAKTLSVLSPCIHSAFFSDGTKLQGTGISNSFGECGINGIDESVKYGRLHVTHQEFIEFNSDGIEGRAPPGQIELSKRYV